jgi:hypothetical protein
MLETDMRSMATGSVTAKSFNATAGALQTNYTDGVTVSHGVTNSSSRPPTTVSIRPNEIITGMKGSYNFRFSSVAFTTSLGRKLGPYGTGSGGNPYTFKGRVYGFLGACCWASGPSQGGCLNGWGAWTPTPPPPPPPPKSPPPPPPRPPSAPLPPVVPSTIFVSDLVTDPNPTWDDGPHTGRLPPKSNPTAIIRVGMTRGARVREGGGDGRG